MESFILIAERKLNFETLKNLFQQKFKCYLATENRLTIENANEYIFIDFGDDIREDYENEKIRNSDSHFYSVLYHSEIFARQIISELKDFNILVDDDNGTILPIKEFLENTGLSASKTNIQIISTK